MQIVMESVRLFRSWPGVIPEGRSYVVDQLPRIVIPGEAYGPAIKEAAAGRPLIMVEWDIAFEPYDLAAMLESINYWPDEVIVAPYWLHPATTGLKVSKLAHRIHDDSLVGLRWVSFGRDQDSPYVDSAGWGMVYFPQQAIDEAPWDILTYPSADTKFAQWCEGLGIKIRVAWDARPKHVHFDIPSEFNRYLTSPE